MVAHDIFIAPKQISGHGEWGERGDLPTPCPIGGGNGSDPLNSFCVYTNLVVAKWFGIISYKPFGWVGGFGWMSNTTFTGCRDMVFPVR